MTEPGGGEPLSFLEELKRRKVVRVAIVYGAAAFAIVQVADLSFPRLQLPDWTVRLVIALAVLGFPVALGLAWAFDVLPAGVRRSEDAPAGAVPPPEAATHRVPAWVSGRSLAVAAVAASLGLGVGVFARAPAAPARDLRSIAVLSRSTTSRRARRTPSSRPVCTRTSSRSSRGSPTSR